MFYLHLKLRNQFILAFVHNKANSFVIIRNRILLYVNILPIFSIISDNVNSFIIINNRLEIRN